MGFFVALKDQPCWRRWLLFVWLMGSAAPAVSQLSVFVTVAPLQTFAERVGGERVTVQVMVPPGRSPETYEPTPRQSAALATADLYVRVGMPFEEAWMPRIVAANPRLTVFDARAGLELRPLADHRHEHGPAGSQPAAAGLDPHIWTSPPLVRIMTARLRDQLIALDPAHAPDYTASWAAFDAELAALDAELRARLAPLRQRRFLVYHPAWGYFAAAYGLEQIAIEHEGKEPGARRLTALIDQARAQRIGVVFIEPQSDRRAAARLAQAIGAQVQAIDPLSPDYAATLRQFAAALQAADQSSPPP